MFHGSIVALVTPMKSNGAIDFDSLHRLIDWHLESSTDGIVVLGTTGESPTITFDEREQIIQKTVAWVNEKIPVIAGTGANNTQEAIHLTQHAMALGVDACLIVTPYYNKPVQEGLYRHFKLIAETVAIPQILYNVPGRTSCDLLPETIARLAPIPNIVGIKESSGDVSRVAKIHQLTQNKLDLLSGEDANALDFIKAGGKGVISVTANVAPQQMHDFSAAALAGDYETAKRHFENLLPLHQNLFVESNPIPVKWLLHAMEKIPNGIRLPLTPLSDDKHQIVRRAFQSLS